MALDLKSIGVGIGPLEKEYSWKDAVIYALGVGAGFDELDYVFENRLKVLPSFSIASVFDFLAQVAIKSNADLSGILHGEQDIIFHGPIPTGGALHTTGAITHIFDKGPRRGALVVARADTFHSDGQKLFTNVFTLFCRKDGGFGGEPGPVDSWQAPAREPDCVEPALPSPEQPLLYRMSGDIFPLHVDPAFAVASGFQKPIMHGLCTHGFACRAVIKHLFPGQPQRMTRFKVRFSRPLYPGVPISTRIWKLGGRRAFFQVVNEESGEIVLDRGVVEWMSQEESQRRQGLGGIRFDGQVAVITGAGAGLGRCYALELARRGASVVVNDLGTSPDGAGSASPAAADAVVDEITALGGRAVASYDSVATVEGAEAIIRRALDSFGRLDILVNNAGVLRDRSFHKMQPQEWDTVMAVHLDGAFNVTRPAFRHMRQAGYGRIVFTSSAAGLYGNFGQTNYSAAKLALVGLLNSLELEGARYGVQVNAVAPIATTRLTRGIIPPRYHDLLQPEMVAPLVLYLCSEVCPASGQIFEAGAGFFNRVALLTGKGTVVGEPGVPPSPEDLARAMDSIKSMDGAVEIASAMEIMGPMLEAFQADSSDPAPVSDAAPSVEGLFRRMPEVFQPQEAAGLDVTFQFEISGEGGGEWYACIQDGQLQVREGVHDSPTTTIEMSAVDFLDFAAGKLDAMQAYTTGRLKIRGDLMKSQLIEKLFAF